MKENVNVPTAVLPYTHEDLDAATGTRLREFARETGFRGFSKLKVKELRKVLRASLPSREAPPIPLFVELCAGTSALSLRLHQEGVKPPVSRLGNKTGYATAILHALGLRPGQRADRYLWCEPDPGCRALLHAYTDREVMQEAARIIRSWKDEEPRALWERLRAEGPIRVGEAREVARHVLTGEWSFRRGDVASGPCGPSRWGVTTWTDGAGNTGTRPATTPESIALHVTLDKALPATVTPDARAVDPREVARWADVLPDARPIEPADLPPGTVAYIDPPYQGTTGYANDLPREDVVALALKWHAAGATVAVSEAEPIPEMVALGWRVVDITGKRQGQKRTFSKQKAEYLTIGTSPDAGRALTLRKS